MNEYNRKCTGRTTARHAPTRSQQHTNTPVKSTCDSHVLLQCPHPIHGRSSSVGTSVVGASSHSIQQLIQHSVLLTLFSASRSSSSAECERHAPGTEPQGEHTAAVCCCHLPESHYLSPDERPRHRPRQHMHLNPLPCSDLLNQQRATC